MNPRRFLGGIAAAIAVSMLATGPVQAQAVEPGDGVLSDVTIVQTYTQPLSALAEGAFTYTASQPNATDQVIQVTTASSVSFPDTWIREDGDVLVSQTPRPGFPLLSASCVPDVNDIGLDTFDPDVAANAVSVYGTAPDGIVCTFLNDVPPMPVTIRKVVDGDDDGTAFAFRSGSDPFATLSGGEQQVVEITRNGSLVEITEAATPGYRLLGVSCTGGLSQLVFDPDPEVQVLLGVSIDTRQSAYTCTFTNQALPGDDDPEDDPDDDPEDDPEDDEDDEDDGPEDDDPEDDEDDNDGVPVTDDPDDLENGTTSTVPTTSAPPTTMGGASPEVTTTTAEPTSVVGTESSRVVLPRTGASLATIAMVGFALVFAGRWLRGRERPTDS